MVLPNTITHPTPEVYICLALILGVIEWGIIKLGHRFSFGPGVTERSSHIGFTPTCGGLIWVITGIAAVCVFGNLCNVGTWIFMAGIAVLGLISMIDDLHPLPPVPRLISQIVVMALTFKQLCYPQAFDIYLLILFCGVGVINAINFLDGICGMLALYGLVVSGSILYAYYTFGSPELQWVMMVLAMVIVAQIVFACFNLKDVIFAGDVGSITLGYIQVFAVITLMLFTRDGAIMIFFAVCIFDTGLTTLHRLFLGESILKPHRMNIYQLLVAELKMPHIVVSLIYALLQLLINALFFLIPSTQHWTFFLTTCALLTIAYFVIRFSLKNIKPV